MSDIKRIHQSDRYMDSWGTRADSYRRDILAVVDEKIVKELEEATGNRAEFNRFGIPMIEVPYTWYGFYGGNGLVGKANCDWLEDNYPDLIVECVDALGNVCMMLDLTKINDDNKEWLIYDLKQLQDYPLFDDEYHSRAEDEVRNEWFEDEFGEDSNKAFTIYMENEFYNEESFDGESYYLPEELVSKIRRELYPEDYEDEDLDESFKRRTLKEKMSKKGILEKFNGKKIKREHIDRNGELDGVLYGKIEVHTTYFNFLFEGSDKQSRADIKSMTNITDDSFEIEIVKCCGGGCYRYSLA